MDEKIADKQDRKSKNREAMITLWYAGGAAIGSTSSVLTEQETHCRWRGKTAPGSVNTASRRKSPVQRRWERRVCQSGQNER